MRASFSVARAGKAGSSVVHPGGWRERRRQRRRLAAQDRLSAHLAELVRIRDLLAAARQVVAAGWVQDAWFVCDDEHGRHHRVDLVQARRMENVPVARACLIGAILHANGGVATADTQLVQRTFDLTWHTLHRRDDEPVRWCPAPPLRAQQLRDLIQWNDRSGRTRTDVQELLSSAQRTADRDIARTRQQLEAASLQ